MSDQCVQLEFLGFNPEYELKSFILTIAEKLHLSAPSDSLMKMAIKKGESSIEASCRIDSQVGTFIAHAVGKNPIRTLHQIEAKIRRQLEKWKRKRFVQEVSI
jgi:hypothetical protein